MPLRPLPYREVRRRLETAGFSIVSQKGSHVKFVRLDDVGTRVVMVPAHREIPVGTVKSIVRQAGMTIDEFSEL